MSTAAESAMTLEQRYEFDLRGYLVVPNVVSPPLLRRIHAVFDEFEDPVARQKYKPWAKFRQPGPLTFRIEQLLEADDAFVELLDPPQVLPMVKELIGAPVRLCQTYAFIHKKRANTALHGGGAVLHHRFLYRYENNAFRCGINPGDGGFAVIPGSHRCRVLCPYYGRNVREVPFLEEVPARAGSAIIFTEDLTHGSLPVTTEHDRRTMYYSYVPIWLCESELIANSPALRARLNGEREYLLQPPRAHDHYEEMLKSTI